MDTNSTNINQMNSHMKPLNKNDVICRWKVGFCSSTQKDLFVFKINSGFKLASMVLNVPNWSLQSLIPFLHVTLKI
jgi:hypothetical protein